MWRLLLLLLMMKVCEQLCSCFFVLLSMCLLWTCAVRQFASVAVKNQQDQCKMSCHPLVIYVPPEVIKFNILFIKLENALRIIIPRLCLKCLMRNENAKNFNDSGKWKKKKKKKKTPYFLNFFFSKFHL